MKVTAHKFEKDDLAIINLYSENAVDIMDSVGDSLFNVPDYDGTTSGSQDGINILIEDDDFDEWREAAKASGALVERSSLEVDPGHYGDGQWEGAEVVAHHDDKNVLYVIFN
jgi:hypothetical protein